jgi:hypothetical protein
VRARVRDRFRRGGAPPTRTDSDNNTYASLSTDNLTGLKFYDSGVSNLISVEAATAKCYVLVADDTKGHVSWVKGPGGTLTNDTPGPAFTAADAPTCP